MGYEELDQRVLVDDVAGNDTTGSFRIVLENKVLVRIEITLANSVPPRALRLVEKNDGNVALLSLLLGAGQRAYRSLPGR